MSGGSGMRRRSDASGLVVGNTAGAFRFLFFEHVCGKRLLAVLQASQAFTAVSPSVVLTGDARWLISGACGATDASDPTGDPLLCSVAASSGVGLLPYANCRNIASSSPSTSSAVRS